MTDEELIELIETKAPEELTLEEIERLGAALVRSAPLQQALAKRLEMEQYLNAALARQTLSADQILARAGRLPPSPGRRVGNFLVWTVCLLLAGFVGLVLTLAMFTPPAPPPEDRKELAAREAPPSLALEPPEPDAAQSSEAPQSTAAAAQTADNPAESATAEMAGRKPEKPPAQTAAAPVAEPWPDLAQLAAQPAPFGAEIFDDFNGRTPTLTDAELRRWFAKVPGQLSTIDTTQVNRNIPCGVVGGVVRLRSPWAPGVALRLTVQEARPLMIHVWRKNQGVSLQYHKVHARSGWWAYAATRKPGTPTPQSLALTGHDDGRNSRVNDAELWTVDLQCDGKLLTLSRGNLRLVSVPFEGMPSEVFFEGRSLLRQLQYARAAELMDELAPGPVVRDVPQPAQETWLTDLATGAAFDKMPDGCVELRCEKTKQPVWAALPLATDIVQEVILQLDEVQPGSGVFLGDAAGKSSHLLGVVQDSKHDRLALAPNVPSGTRWEAAADTTETLISYCSKRPWIKMLLGCGSVRYWTSTDGVHWGRACDPLVNPQSALGSVGLYLTSGIPERRIRLRRVMVRELPAIGSLAPVELRRRVPAFAMQLDMGGWLEAVYASQPADADTSQWRIACAVGTLAANTAAAARTEILDNLANDVIASDKPWKERLQFLEEAALICGYTDDPGLALRFSMHFCRLGGRLAREGQAEALAAVAQAQLMVPAASRIPINLGLDASDREEVLRLVYGRRWEELRDLCAELRFGRNLPPKTPLLIDWAEALTGRQGVAAAGAGLLKSDWRHPLIAELSKEAYNVLADLEAALEGKSYRDACQIITSAGNQTGPGVLPDSRDRDLLTSLSGAVNLAMREHPALGSTMNEQFGPVGRLRIRQAIADGDAAAVEAGTVQFTGTEAAAEAHLWLADRGQAAGAFAQALAHYREAIRFAPPALRNRAVAGAQLAAAMMGQTFPEELVGSPEFGDLRLAPEEFSRLLSEMRSRRSIENAAGLAMIASPRSAAPAAATYEAKVRGRLDGDVGQSPQNLPADLQYFQVDWVARQCAAVVAGDRLILSNRFQVSCFNLRSGQFDWRAMVGGDQAPAHDWSLTPMRPLATAGRIFVRRLLKSGPTLACLETGSGKLLWSTKPEPDKFVVCDPLFMQDELFALTVARADQEFVLSLCIYDPASGVLLSESPLVRLREHWWQQRNCQALVLDDTFVVACGGSIFRADLTGHIRWLRRETWVPQTLDRSWLVQYQSTPIESGGRLFVSQPGVREVTCVDAETGRLVWRAAMPDLRRIVGVAQGRVLVQSDAGFTALDVANGNVLWEHAAAGLLEALWYGEGGNLVYTRSMPVGDGKSFYPLLMWLDPATGRAAAASALDALRHERPRLGSLVAVGDRFWALFGRGEQEAQPDIVELAPKGPAIAPQAPQSESDRLWLRQVDPALRSAAEEVLPEWIVLGGPTDKKYPLRISQWHDQENVLEAQAAKDRPLRFARRVALPADRPARLKLRVASGAKWKLQVQASGKEIFSQVLDGNSAGGNWQDLEVSLAPFVGQTVWLVIRQEDEDGSQPQVKWKSVDVID